MMILTIIIILIAIAYVSLISALIFGLKRGLIQKADNVQERIKLSVIVPFRDEEAKLPILLKALSTQTLSREFYEVIFVDDHSSDSSNSIVGLNISEFPNFRIIANPIGFNGKKAALAYGIKQAVYPVVVFTDADCVPSEYWLDSISMSFAKGSCFLIGTVVMSPIDSFVRKLQSLEYSSLMATTLGSCGIGHPVIASSANLAFRNDLLKVDAGLMNPKITSGDDMFLLHKAKRLKDFRIEGLNSQKGIVKTNTEESV